jgi:hypothetical protein
VVELGCYCKVIVKVQDIIPLSKLQPMDSWKEQPHASMHRPDDDGQANIFERKSCVYPNPTQAQHESRHKNYNNQSTKQQPNSVVVFSREGSVCLLL